MRLVEITGHLIDPGKVSYVGPIMSGPAGTGFEVVVDGVKLFIPGSRQELLDAIESAQPEMTVLEATACRFPWAKHEDQPNENGEWLWGDCWPEHQRKHGKDEIGPFPSDPPFSDYKPDMPKHEAPSDVLLGIECGPEVRGTFRDGKFVKAMKVEDAQPPLSCPFDCKDEVPNTVPCRLCHVTGERERIRAQ